MYDESKPEPPIEMDTTNKTKFYPDDMDKPWRYRLDMSRTFSAHYTALSSQNRSVYNLKWANNTILRHHDNLAILDAVADTLDLSRYHHNVARELMSTAPLSKWSSPNGIDVYLVAFCLCEVVLRNDPRTTRSFYLGGSPENNDPLFTDLWNGLEYRDSELASCHQKVMRYVDWEPVNWEERPN